MKWSLIELDRGKFGTLLGFLVAENEWCLVINTLDLDTFRLNGFSAVRRETVRRHRIYTGSNFWFVKAARKLGIEPRVPGRLITANIDVLLESVHEEFPLIALEREEAAPDKRYIGFVERVTEKTVVLQGITSGATWGKVNRLQKASITRIDFGGGYEVALSLVSSKRD